MARRPEPMLLEVAIGHLRDQDYAETRAALDAIRACAVIWRYARAREQLGHWPTQLEYADHIGKTDRMAQHEWAAVRRAFPGEESPERLARIAHSEGAGRLDHIETVLFCRLDRELFAAVAA